MHIRSLQHKDTVKDTMQLPAQGGGAPRWQKGILLTKLDPFLPISFNVRGMYMCVSGLLLGVPPRHTHFCLPICEDL